MKFLLFHLLHMNCDVSLYQLTGQCLYISVLNLISQDYFWISFCTLFVSRKQIMKSNKETYTCIRLAWLIQNHETINKKKNRKADDLRGQ
jgi:hypothetical protein